MVSIFGIISGVIALSVLLIPRIWKTAEEKEKDREEKAKEAWDAFYKRTNK